ncbi:hypothetical protein CBL_21148, partial [Carabus blaptoides fortunei]
MWRSSTDEEHQSYVCRQIQRQISLATISSMSVVSSTSYSAHSYEIIDPHIRIPTCGRGTNATATAGATATTYASTGTPPKPKYIESSDSGEEHNYSLSSDNLEWCKKNAVLRLPYHYENEILDDSESTNEFDYADDATDIIVNTETKDNH